MHCTERRAVVMGLVQVLGIARVTCVHMILGVIWIWGRESVLKVMRGTNYIIVSTICIPNVPE